MIGTSLLFSGSIAGLLTPFDSVAPTAGYSLRNLSLSYSGAVVRVRKDITGNPEQDFTAGQITNGTLSNFLETLGTDAHSQSVSTQFEDVSDVSLICDCNSGGTDELDAFDALYENGFVSKWYDQFGSNDATQTTAAEQPKIWDASTGLVTENGKPALDFDGVDDTLSLSSSLNIGGSPSIIGVLNTAAGDILWRAGGSDYWYVQASQIFRYRNGDFDETWLNTDGLPAMDGSQKLIATYKNTNSVLLTVDGVSLVTKTEAGGTGADGFFNNIGSDLLFIDGVWQEIIIYNSDQSSNRTKIEDNINAYYDIY